MANAADSAPSTYAGFDHHARDLPGRFHATMAMLREEGPAGWCENHGGYWVVTGYDAVVEVLRDPGTYCSGQGVTVVRNPTLLPPIETDGAEHRNWRKILNPFFAPSAVERYAEGIRQVARRLIDAFAARGSCDLAEEFILIFPGTVFFELFLGLERARLDDALEWTLTIATPGTSSSKLDAAYRGLAEICSNLLEQRKEHAGDGTHLLDALLKAEIGGMPLSDERRAACLTQLIMGALATTADVIGYACRRLCEDQDLQSELREHPQVLSAAVEEFIRLDSPVPALARTATRDVDLSGHQVGAGEKVLVCFASANRDGYAIARPDEVDLSRERSRHVAFGAGAHLCLGIHLARLQVGIALEEVLTRLGGLALQPGAEVRYAGTYSGSPMVRSLPVRFTPI